jgi:alpha,alpha-trehalose phosphorylase
MDLAYDYLGEAALMDLHDLEHNTRDGLHMAALAGAWISIVCGLGGLRDHGGVLSFAPRLPNKLHRLRFALTWRKEVLGVEIDAQQATYTMKRDGGHAIDLLHYGERVRVSADQSVTMKIPQLERPRLEVRQPAGREPRRRH